MKMINLLTFAVGLTAMNAVANDHLGAIRDHASALHREFRGIEQLAKKKSTPLADLQTRVNGTAERVAQLKKAVTDFESASPHLASHPEWKRAKELVGLIDVYHSLKAQLIAGGSVKDRGLFKAHAGGLAKRSSVLLETTDRLVRNSGV